MLYRFIESAYSISRCQMMMARSQEAMRSSQSDWVTLNQPFSLSSRQHLWKSCQENSKDVSRQSTLTWRRKTPTENEKWLNFVAVQNQIMVRYQALSSGSGVLWLCYVLGFVDVCCFFLTLHFDNWDEKKIQIHSKCIWSSLHNSLLPPPNKITARNCFPGHGIVHNP